jgi:hypothetical protein
MIGMTGSYKPLGPRQRAARQVNFGLIPELKPAFGERQL